jgi:hypothetical protein
MKHTSLKKIALLVIVSLVLLSQETMAHPLGLTFTNIKYSRETITLSTRIFYADFWHEFQDYTKVKNKDYVKTGIDANDKKDFANYFNKNLKIWVNNKEIHFQTINIDFERHEEDAYILLINLTYNVTKLAGAKIKIKNTVLLNSIGGQKHMVNFSLKDPNTLSHGIITLDKSNPECQFKND